MHLLYFFREALSTIDPLDKNISFPTFLCYTPNKFLKDFRLTSK